MFQGFENCALQILDKIDDSLLSAPGADSLTPLHIAAKKGLPGVVSALVGRGANLVALDKQGKSH